MVGAESRDGRTTPASKRSSRRFALPPAGAADIGGEIFRWELATAVAGSLLGIHPFDQPDVDAAKVAARRLVAAAHEGTIEPRGERLHVAREWSWFGGGPALELPSAAAERRRPTCCAPTSTRCAPATSSRCSRFCRAPASSSRRSSARAWRWLAGGGAATTLGFGPRYLHSTGQYMKGGPDRGVYLFVTRHVDDDLAIPGQEIGFGALQRAQALGDIEVLLERGRRVLHVELAGGARARAWRDWSRCSIRHFASAVASAGSAVS